MSLYGMTFAQKLIQRGDYEQAVIEATRHIEREPESPEPYHDRARALSNLERYEESVSDYRRALDLDRAARILQDDEVDDGLFSTILSWAERQPTLEQKLTVLGRYREILPEGNHLDDAEQWALRFRGLLKTTFVKPRE